MATVALRLVVSSARPSFHRRMLAHARLRRRRESASGSRPDGSQSAAAGGRRHGRGRARRQGLRRGRWARRRSAARARLWRSERRRDDRSHLGCPGRRSRDRRLARRLVEEARRGQNEGDRHHHGEHAEGGCGYARKTTPHECPIDAPASILNLNRGIRTSRSLSEDFLQHERVRGRLGDPSFPSHAVRPLRPRAAVVVQQHVRLLSL